MVKFDQLGRASACSPRDAILDEWREGARDIGVRIAGWGRVVGRGGWRRQVLTEGKSRDHLHLHLFHNRFFTIKSRHPVLTTALAYSRS
jgi:hypothetical protein